MFRRYPSCARSASLAAVLIILSAGAGALSAPVSAETYVIGKSVRDRPIEVRRFGDPQADFKALVVGSIHGDEPEGMRVVRRMNQLARLGLKRVDLWSIRTVNPDGIARGTRKNTHGVDLNRNFPRHFDPALNDGYNSGPFPLSEPESRAVARLSERQDFDLAIWYHQPWGRTLVPCNGTARFAKTYARLSGLRAGRSCDRYVPGSAIDWMHHRFGTAAFVVEFGAGRLSQPQVKRHGRAAIRLMKIMR